MAIKIVPGIVTLMLAFTGYLTAAADTPPAFEDILKIDVHAHIFDNIPELDDMLKRTNTRLVNVCLYGERPELLIPAQRMAEFLQHRYPGSFYFVSTFDLTRRNEPDYADQVIEWLDDVIEKGALMIKIWKEVGMGVKAPDGSFLMPDDPIFDPVYAHLAERGVPLLAHIADPIDAWRPLTPGSPHYGYYSENPEWHVYGREGYPSHDTLMEARDNIMVKHPDLILVGAHFGSMTHDLEEVAKRFERFPNFYVDVSARTPQLRSYPVETVREFFIKYQDRIMYGVDVGRYSEGRIPGKEERVAFTNSLENTYRADYAYYSLQGMNTIRGREVQCLGLPTDVLEKFFHKNAQRLMAGLRD